VSRQWKALLVVEGWVTRDNRIIDIGALSWDSSAPPPLVLGGCVVGRIIGMSSHGRCIIGTAESNYHLAGSAAAVDLDIQDQEWSDGIMRVRKARICAVTAVFGGRHLFPGNEWVAGS